MAFTSLNELDVIFISYDEDNCEEHWAELFSNVPWAKRVHGVRGSDASHKAAANLSDTDLFISVDADNIVDYKFFDVSFDFEHPKFLNRAISFEAKNIINGLVYGNGGLKIWPKEHLLNIKSHELADPSGSKINQIEFCGDDNYTQMCGEYCTTYPNGSPRQAFRAGFREGVKMSLDGGEKVNPQRFEKSVWHGNYKRLITWCSIGADVENGLWAIYGARYGCWLTNLTDWDYINVRDFEYINKMFEEEIKPKFIGDDQKCYKSNYSWSKEALLQEIRNIGVILRKEMKLDIAEFDEVQSQFYKKSYINMPRMNKLMTETELFELRKLNS